MQSLFLGRAPILQIPPLVTEVNLSHQLFTADAPITIDRQTILQPLQLVLLLPTCNALEFSLGIAAQEPFHTPHYLPHALRLKAL